MAAKEIATKEVAELQHLIQGVAKNFVERVYGPQGMPWGTQFTELEEIAVQIGQAVSRAMCNQALQQQALQQQALQQQAHEATPSVCPDCGQAGQPAVPEPRLLTTRAGETHWQEPQHYCRHCRRSFFPSVEEPGD
jgi:hypothetical protein